jgi:exportin-1
MRGVKSDILELLTAFVVGSSDIDSGGEQIAMNSFMPPVMREVLEDYQTSPPVARDSKTLAFFGSAVASLKDLMTPVVPSILEAIFEPTLSMITTNMLDYPEHRTYFFRFIREANQFCFQGLFVPVHQKLMIDSIVWAFKHTERNISEMGLEVLVELMQNVSRASEEAAQSFYQTYLLVLLQDVLGLMTDRLHKSGFKLQAAALRQIFQAVQGGAVRAPLFSLPGDNLSNLKNHVASLIVAAFPNLTRAQVITFVVGLFDSSMDLTMFKQHMRDFLIQIKVRCDSLAYSLTCCNT